LKNKKKKILPDGYKNIKTHLNTQSIQKIIHIVGINPDDFTFAPEFLIIQTVFFFFVFLVKSMNKNEKEMKFTNYFFLN
jgi:hypothetical protein